MTDNDSSGVSEAETRRSGGASTSGELEDVEDSRAFQVRRRRRTRPVDPRSSPLPGEFHPRKTLSGHIWHAPSRRSTAFVSSFLFSHSPRRAWNSNLSARLLPLSRSNPTQAIDEGTSSGTIHAWVAEKAKAKFRELHDALRASAARRGALSREADAAAATLRRVVEERAAAAARGENLVVETEWVQRELTEEEEAMIDAMVDDAKRAEDEADLAEARLHKLDTELYELTRRRDAHRRRRRDAEEEHEAALAPAVAKLRAETLELRDEIKADAEKLRLAREERDAAADALEASVAESAERASRRSDAVAATESLRGVPEKTRERCVVLADAAETLRRRDASLGARVAALESEMEAQSERVVRMAETFSRRAGALEKAELTDEAKARDADDVAAELEGAGFEGDALLETKALLELDRKRASSENDAAVAALKRATKEKEQTLRRLRRAQLARARLDEEAPRARERAAEAAVVFRSRVEDTRAVGKELAALQKTVDSQTRAYMEQESLGTAAAAAVEESLADAARLRASADAKRREAAERAELVKRAESAVRAAERRLDAETREYARAAKALASKNEVVAESAARLDDLNRRAEAQARLRRLAEEQRAKLRVLAAATKKAAVDVGEGLSVLANEIAALREDDAGKAADLERARGTLREARQAVALTRTKLNRAKEEKRRADDARDAETGEAASLRAAITAAKRNLDRAKATAETVVASRDKIGNAVLDRDDELAALYAKNATQAEVLAAGELALAARAEEVRALEAELAETRRSHEIAASAAAFAPALDEQIVALRAQLLRERREAERLGAEAEDPSNERRRRDLAGDAPDRDALRAKLRGLEKRELERDVALRKKDAELEELTRVSDRLRAAAAAGRAETLELARAVVDARAKAFSRRRETEALAAELAMYRASALSFEETLGAVRDALARAERNIAAGAPPDEDAAREWSRATRYASAAARAAARREKEYASSREDGGGDAEDDENDLFDDGAGKENAASRPNAYVPTHAASEGLPKPYGKNAPFKPAPTPPHLRHYRPPADEREE